jgi:hypothetical protein
MKKFFIILSSLLVISTSNSCSDKELELFPPSLDDIQDINSEDKLQKFLNAGYLEMSSVNAFGTQIMAIGDVLGDQLYVTSGKSFSQTYNMNYNGLENEFSFYSVLYNAIMNCNLVINNTQVPANSNVSRMKAEARILRAFAYFTLVNYYSPTPTSGVNQEYGVPLILSDYDVSILPARATVAQVYDQVISDLMAGLNDAPDIPVAADGAGNKVFLSKTAAKLILSRVYLTRRAPGDVQMALQYSSEIVNNSPADFAKISKDEYRDYFMGSSEETAENRKETIWELDINSNTNLVNGLGANMALPTIYDRLVIDRRAILVNKDFYDSFPHTDLPSLPVPNNPSAPPTPQSLSPDVRRGDTKTTVTNISGVPNAVRPAGLMSTINLVATDNPRGAWINKYPRLTAEGNFQRNIKILRFAEAQLNRIEALILSGQTVVALAELNAFALSRGGSTYTEATLQNILKEKGKEFYGEGQRFLDLKRHSLPIVRNGNCVANCNVPANDKLFTLPIDQTSMNYNPNLKQYPGY